MKQRKKLARRRVPPLLKIPKKDRVFRNEDVEKATLGVKILYNPLKSAPAVKVNVPKLDFVDVKRGMALSFKEKRRNKFLVNEIALQKHREEYGREEFKKLTAAAVRIQTVFRGAKGKQSVAELVAEMKRRMKEEEELLQRLKDEARKAKEAETWAKKVAQLPESPLKTVLQNLTTFDTLYELSMDGWHDQKENTIEALRTFTSAQRLEFRNCKIKNKKVKDDDAKRLAAVVVHQKELQYFTAEKCDMNALDLEAILGALSYGARKSLREISVAGNWLGRGRWDRSDDVGRPIYNNEDVATKNLASCIRNIPTLQKLDLSKNYMGEKAFGGIVSGRAFLKPSSLVNVDLSYNLIGQKSAFTLSQVICQSPMLRELDISGNDLKEPGLAIIESPLSVHRSIEVLGLAENQLLNRGTNILCRIIKCNLVLRCVNLANNKFTEDGIIELAKAMTTARGLSRIEVLDLSQNRLSNNDEVKTSALRNLAIMLETCSRLRAFHFRGVNLIKHQKLQPVYRKRETQHLYCPMSILVSRLSKNNTLQTLDLRENGLRDPVNPPFVAFEIISAQQELIPALHLPKETQEIVAGFFRPYLLEEPREEKEKKKITDVILLILAFSASQRQVLL